MYAVIKASGHQYRVSEGEEITIDYQKGNVGDKLSFDQVLMVSDKVGAPLVDGASVEAVIKKQTHNPKVVVFKFKRRKDYKRTRGHKQPMTVVEISKISH